MKRKILITGDDSELKTKLVKQFMDSNYIVAVTVTSNNKKPNSSIRNFIEIPWNNKSFLSTKNVILECLDKMEGIDDVLTIFSSEQGNMPIHQISSMEIEKFIDSNLKGNIFILKETILYFEKIGAGNIFLIHNIRQNEILAPLPAVEIGGLSSLTKSLFVAYQNEQFTINSYKANSGEVEDYAEYIFNSIKGRTKPVHGKIFKFQAKGKPFFLP